MTEQELVAAARQGDGGAFAQLVGQYEGKVYNLAFRMTGNREDAADLTQEAFLNAWRGLASFQGSASFSTWLYRLTSNACIDFLRRESRRQTVSLTAEQEDSEESREWELPDGENTPHRALEQKELRFHLQQGLDTLSPEHKQILLLREMEGLSYQEIARLLDLEEGTVKSRIARARLALRRFFLALEDQ